MIAQRDLEYFKNNNNLQKTIIVVVLLSVFIYLSVLFGVQVTGYAIAILVVAKLLVRLSGVVNVGSKPPYKSDPKYKPFVSIHVACKSEPAELVIKTIDAMTKLDYPNYEVIVINSNSTDTKNWHRIQKFVEKCGKNFKFVHLDVVSGFKAGALNYLNAHHFHDKIEIEAFVDCDYVVTPDFLNKTVGYFKNPKVGIVQAPQDYCNANSDNIGLVYEYRSFFAIVMHQAQRLNLVTFTGTMGLIRASLLKKGLAWNEWCITEDTEAGVFINSLGYKGVYVDESLGKGLMPFEYSSLIKQRQRWAFGNMQIIKKDVISVTENKDLTIKQKYAFFAQLITWFHMDLVVAVFYSLLGIANYFGYPDKSLTFASNLTLIVLGVSLISNFIYFLVGLRKNVSISGRIKAFLTHYGLLYVMSSSWLICLFGQKLGFNVTNKDKSDTKIRFKQYRSEFTIIAILLVGLVFNFFAKGNVQLDLLIIIPFSAVEAIGIYYLYQALTKSNQLPA
jgi:cellulose synthase/poly-beta-1,6-N-acetylglucosamine synthase-like glycosyltransferase